MHYRKIDVKKNYKSFKSNQNLRQKMGLLCEEYLPYHFDKDKTISVAYVTFMVVIFCFLPTKTKF